MIHIPYHKVSLFCLFPEKANFQDTLNISYDIKLVPPQVANKPYG